MQPAKSARQGSHTTRTASDLPTHVCRCLMSMPRPALRPFGWFFQQGQTAKSSSGCQGSQLLCTNHPALRSRDLRRHPHGNRPPTIL